VDFATRVLDKVLVGSASILPPSLEGAALYRFTSAERTVVNEAAVTHVLGDPETVRKGRGQLRRRTAADELMLSTATISYEAQLRSLTLKEESWELVSTKDPMPRTLASLRLVTRHVGETSA
jgi:hypothetical protein